MKTSISVFKLRILAGSAFVVLAIFAQAQSLDSIITRVRVDTASTILNMDAAYNRPFLTIKKSPVALGGYLEANVLHQNTDGVSTGVSFQARRLTLFLSATIAKRIRFLSEIEFEDGAKEIGIEFAAMDVIFHPAINFRGGIIMNPIGAFNQNHDGPKWEFIERPDVAVNLLPATWSNAGFGVYGKTYKENWVFGYEAYVTNGFNESIIDNEHNKTFLPAAKEDEGRFENNHSGRVLFTGKIAIKNRNLGEIGISYMGGAYSKFESEDMALNATRRVDVIAFDLNTTIQKTGTFVVGEFVYTFVDVPEPYTQQYGNKQKGMYIDIVQPVLKKKILDWEKATLNIAMRLDYVDWNIGTFKESNTEIGDQLWAVTPAISFRPSVQTVFRLNYRYQWQKDILNNPASKTVSWLFGLSTYF